MKTAACVWRIDWEIDLPCHPERYMYLYAVFALPWALPFVLCMGLGVWYCLNYCGVIDLASFV